MTIQVLLYYKYVPLQNPEEFVEKTKQFCQQRGILGRILISEQGVNGTCAGERKAIDAYKQWMQKHPEFSDIWFKEQTAPKNPFTKCSVRYRKELVTLRQGKIDPQKGGEHVSAQQVHELVKQYGDDVVFFDARNEIESRIGRFKNAICPDIKTFREIPQIIKEYAPKLKNKKVIMYCTGGIRCETASVLLKQQGVEDVYQIDGGIYNYCQTYPDGLFEGTCYVFDERMQIGFGKQNAVLLEDDVSEEKIISACEFCQKKTARVINDERYLERVQRVCCNDCDAKLDISRIRTKQERQVLLAQHK
ncbi:MAG: rhodanese-related sulfurtransferase [Candidatus Woesearchaeota archaeon]